MKSVLDIGSNDGTQLKHFQRLGYEVLGVESSRTTSELANQAGVPTVHGFFNRDLAESLDREFDVINAAGVFFHLEELHSATDGIRHCLNDDGVFVVQFLYMKQIVQNLAFDQIYHEHLLYYNLETIETLLSRHGMRLFDAYLAPIHGGSVIAFVTKDTSRPPSERLEEMLRGRGGRAKQLAGRLSPVRRADCRPEAAQPRLPPWRKAQGKRIFGFGAPVKGNTLLNYFDIGPETIDCLVERNELRRGLYSPGKHIPAQDRTGTARASGRLLCACLELPRRDPGTEHRADRTWRRVLLPDPTGDRLT